MADISDLLQTLEEIRLERYPDISPVLIRSILEFESDCTEQPDRRRNAQKFIEKLLDSEFGRSSSC